MNVRNAGLEYNYRYPVDFPFISIKFIDTGDYFVSGKNSCLISFVHERKVEKANKVTIEAAFAPTATSTVGGFTSANQFERLLVGHFSEVRIEYGYLGATRAFDTLITDYTVSFEAGYLTYTLSGITEIVAANYAPVNFIYPETEIEAANMSMQGLADKLNKFIDENYNSNENIRAGGTHYSYRVELDEISPDDFTLMGFSYENPIYVSGVGVMTVLKDVLKKVNTSQEANSAKFLTFYVDESSDDKVIYIQKVSFLVDANGNITSSDTYQNMTKLSFEWNTKDSNVISWNPQFKGSVAIFGYKGQEVEYVDPASGQPVKVSLQKYTQEAVQVVTENEIKEIKNRIDNFWAEMAKVPYTATMEVIGTPNLEKAIYNATERYSETETGKEKRKLLTQIKDIRLGDTIDVQVHLGFDLHHSSGIYLVRSITDTINSQGFLSSYDLVKTQAFNVKTAKGVTTNTGLTQTDTIQKIHRTD